MSDSYVVKLVILFLWYSPYYKELCYYKINVNIWMHIQSYSSSIKLYINAIDLYFLGNLLGFYFVNHHYCEETRYFWCFPVEYCFN